MDVKTSDSARPIGVFDSGIGGLTVFRELVRALPGEQLLYFGDTARVPYGTKSGDTVIRFTLEAGDFLRDQGVKALVIACNTASAYALPALERQLSIPILGVIDSGARAAVEATRSGRVGVIATPATVASGAYERALRSLDPALAISVRACPLFVPLVEEGWTHHAVTRMVAEEYLAPIRAENVDTLILGSTHYPHLRDVVQEVMGPEVRLVDAGEKTALALSEMLRARALAAPRGARPEHRIFLTDLLPAFRDTGERFLGQTLPPVEVVSWQDERWVRV